MSRPVVIEAAINGVTTPEQNPAVPRLPEEIARDFTPITPEETAEIKAQAMGRAPIFELAAV